MGVKFVKKNNVMTIDLEKLKYPIGKFDPPKTITETQLKDWINQLANLPQELAAISFGLSDDQLANQYRPDGWTVRQVIHHLADSHINAYTRVKLTLTENRPEVRPYDEVAWAELTDGKTGEISLSIAIIKSIHERLVTLLNSLNFEDFQRVYYHPAAKQEYTLAYLVGNYAWHGKHHLAHIQLALNKKEGDELIVSPKLKQIFGTVNLPADFDEKKEIRKYFETKHL